MQALLAKYLMPLLAVAILALAGFAGVQTYRLQAAKTAAADKRAHDLADYAASLKDVADREHASAARSASIAEGYQHALADINAAAARIPADIRSGVLELRDIWTAQNKPARSWIQWTPALMQPSNDRATGAQRSCSRRRPPATPPTSALQAVIRSKTAACATAPGVTAREQPGRPARV